MKIHCANCGDPTLITDTTDMERQELGWCPPCLRQAKHFYPDPEKWTWRFKELLAIQKAKEKKNTRATS